MIDFAPADTSGPHNARFDRLILEGHAGETGSRHVDVDRITEMVLQRGDSGRGDRAVPGEELGMAPIALAVLLFFFRPPPRLNPPNRATPSSRNFSTRLCAQEKPQVGKRREIFMRFELKSA